MVGWLATAACAQLALPGSYEVGASGELKYSLPLQVPPGVAGMQPRLRMDYNGRSGNGLVGVGWTLAGLPSISRCPRTMAQDGEMGAVAYDANDRFCLDGQRLIVTAGTYGEVWSEYRTEIDSLTKLTVAGVAPGGGPAAFVAKTKDGLTLEFGYGGNSSLLVIGKSPAVVRTWAVSSVADTKGNTQTVSYLQAGAGQIYPDRIEYTSNAAAGLPAANRIEFGYEARDDVISGYRGGFGYATDQRLSSVVTKTAGAVVSTYRLTYAGNRSSLVSITKCAPSGQCTPATEFGYGGPLAGFSPMDSVAVAQTESSVLPGRWFSFDTNGDGRTDLVHMTGSGGTYRVWRSMGNAQFSISEYGANSDSGLLLGRWVQIDVNGDGLADLVHVEATPGSCRYWKSKGDGSFDVLPCLLSPDDIGLNILGYQYPLSYSEWLVSDVNGDGLADMVHVSAAGLSDENDARIRTYLSNGDGTFSSVVTPVESKFDFTSASDKRQKWLVMDVNGDGLSDLVYTWSQYPHILTLRFLWIAQGNGQFAYAGPVVFTGALETQGLSDWYQIDLNGDGLMDLVGIHPGAGKVIVGLSKGDGTFVRSLFSSAIDTSLGSGTWQVIDTNGDGLADLVHTPSNLTSGSLYVWRSKGDGTFDVVLAAQGADLSCAANCTAMLPGDFEGTGAPGFVRLDGASTNAATSVKSVWLMGVAPRNLLESVNNGIGGRTSWGYAVLPKMLGSTYSRETPTDAAAVTVASAIPVVERVETAVEWNRGENRVQYGLKSATLSYDSARFDRKREFVGFNWVQQKEADTGLTSRTYFDQTFPYVGMPKRFGKGKGVGEAGWRDLSDMSISLGCLLPTNEAACAVAAGNIYFPYVRSTFTQAWDLDGTALPRTTVVNDNPDAYGNFPRVTTNIANPDGSPSSYSKVANYLYFNDPVNWIIGRVIKREVVSTGPDVPAPVVPGSGGLPSAPVPTLPAQMAAALLAPILQMLLLDD